VRKLGLTRKQEEPYRDGAAERRVQELRRRFLELAKTLDPRRLVFLDEADSHIG